jgi:GDP-L-fucose synthase
VLVTGATGMVGRQLVKKLLNKGAKVRGVSLDEIDYENEAGFAKVEFILGDLRNFDFCKQITSSVDIVFHLAGIKGSPLLTKEQPNSFFVNTMMFNLNVIEASRINKVDKFLYTSSVGVYSPAEIFKEESVWQTMPSENDKFAGWAKRMGELQLEAAKIEHNFSDTFIVRPANIYGPWDNFDPNTAMVIPSLISRVISGENPLSVWGDGSSVRDFVYSGDVANAMLFVMENSIHEPVNIGSASGVTVKEITEILVEIIPELRIKWDTSKPSGDKIRVMDMSKLTKYGFKTEVTLREGIIQTFKWYNENQELFKLRYNAFTEKKS